jgi:hypothetical protein
MSGRQTLATLLAIVSALCAVLGACAWSVRDGVVARDAFVHRAVVALGQAPVRSAVAAEVADQVAARLPAGVVSSTELAAIVDRSIRTATFRRALRRGAGNVNDALFSSSTGGSADLDVDLAAVLRQTSPQLAAAVSGGTSAHLVTVRTDSLPIDTRRAGDLVRTLAVVLPALAFFALAGALAVAVSRRGVVVAGGLAALVAGALLLVGLLVGHAAGQAAATSGDGLDRAQARAAAGAIWDVYTSGPKTLAIVALVAGALLSVIGFGTLTYQPTRGAGNVAGQPGGAGRAADRRGAGRDALLDGRGRPR